VSKPLIITTGPVPSRLSTPPLAKLEMAEQMVSTSVIKPAASIGCNSVARMVGQATPSTLSGRPRLMKAK
jgi:hypothetical protein